MRKSLEFNKRFLNSEGDTAYHPQLNWNCIGWQKTLSTNILLTLLHPLVLDILLIRRRKNGKCWQFIFSVYNFMNIDFFWNEINKTSTWTCILDRQNKTETKQRYRRRLNQPLFLFCCLSSTCSPCTARWAMQIICTSIAHIADNPKYMLDSVVFVQETNILDNLSEYSADWRPGGDELQPPELECLSYSPKGQAVCLGI